MKALKYFMPLSLAAALVVGCSAETQQEAKEALEATGEAASSAAEDTKANIDKAAETISDRIDSDNDSADTVSEPASGGDSPDDADAVPEADEP